MFNPQEQARINRIIKSTRMPDVKKDVRQEFIFRLKTGDVVTLYADNSVMAFRKLNGMRDSKGNTIGLNSMVSEIVVN